jgi:hypothetical protein
VCRTLQNGKVLSMSQMSHGQYCVVICVTFSCHLSAKSTSAQATSLCMAFRVMFHHTLKQCSHPFGHLNSMPIFSEILSALFYYAPYTTTLFASELQKPFKQPILHITMFCTNILICFKTPPPCRVCCSTDT